METMIKALEVLEMEVLENELQQRMGGLLTRQESSLPVNFQTA